MSNEIKWAMRVESTKVLGPFERAVLWVYGCCFNCEGCVAQRYKNGPFETAGAEEMAQWFLSTEREHLTVSGGEPFLQAEPLARMILAIRARRDVGVIIYSGFTHEELLAKAETDEAMGRLLGLIDILIDGRYERELDDGRPYVGSSNQRVLLLTDRYAGDADAYYHLPKGRQIELKPDLQKTVMIGVPSANQKRLWERLKQLGDRQ